MAENTKKRNATKKKMQDALMVLYNQYDFQKISVTMLCQEAGIHRSTFYLYYNSVDELLREIENDILSKIRAFSGKLSQYLLSKNRNALEKTIKDTETIMVDFYKWQFSLRDYLNPLLGSYGDPYFIQHYEELIQNDIHPALKVLGYDYKKEPYILKYITGGVVKTNHDWLLHGDISAEELVRLQRTMVFENPLLPPLI